MTREMAIAKLAEELKNHQPDKTFGCECQAKIYRPRGKQHIKLFDALPLRDLWAEHVAEISFEYAKGF